jgi:ABC-type sugar transport system ATPase subunit
MNNNFLLMKDISKSYPGVQALKSVGLEVNSGEVMAIVGENGAGKSTLLKILAGAENADSGEIFIQGEKVEIKSTRDSNGLGIKVIYQELNLATHLSIAENLFVQREFKTRLGAINSKKMKLEAEKVMKVFGLNVPGDTLVENLNIAHRQLIEIAKALADDARIVVMDEPTSSLTQEEGKKLFEVIKDLKNRGVSVIYVSHRMQEIFEIADRVTVLRDGQLVGVRDAGTSTPSEIVELMIGRELTDLYGSALPMDPAKKVEVLKIENLSLKSHYEDVSLTARSGEILVISGLIGSGRSEFALSVFGALKSDSGQILLDGKPFSPKNPQHAMKKGIAFVPEDRKKQALFMQLTVRENMSSASLKAISKLFILDRKLDSNLTEVHSQELHLRSSAIEVQVGTLSGGNQQKVVLGRWISRKPRVLILDEPTRGVDISAKSDLYTLIREIAKDGAAVIVISSDLMEVIGLGDRILVMREGHLVGEIEGKDATESNVMALATGVRETK